MNHSAIVSFLWLVADLIRDSFKRGKYQKFDFDNTISKLDESGLLFQVMERFGQVDLHPDAIDNHTMGTIFEELIRNPGENALLAA